MPYDVVTVLERRNGPRQLCDQHDDDNLFEVAVCQTCCRSRLCHVLSDDLLAADISSASHTNRYVMGSRRLGEVEQATAECGPVLRHLGLGVTPSGRRPYRRTIPASSLCCGRAGIGTTGAQFTVCVYGYARLACRRGDIDHQSIITKRILNMKKLSLTSLVKINLMMLKMLIMTVKN